MDCGLRASLSTNVIAPVRLPACVGENVTFTLHVARAAMVPTQVLVRAKSPVAVTDAIFRAVTPSLVSVTAWDLLAVPTVWFGQFSLTMKTMCLIAIEGTDETPAQNDAEANTNGETILNNVAVHFRLSMCVSTNISSTKSSASALCARLVSLN